MAELQDGAISRRQALTAGMSPDVIDARLRSQRWQAIHRGVYAISAGQPARSTMLWAAVLKAGSGAALSHQTAAELFDLSDRPSSRIHVTIPESRRIAAIPGVVIHRSSSLSRATHPAIQPPRVRLEETVLDLADQAATFEAAFSVICAACQRMLTTPAILAGAMANRARLRWRGELVKALGDISSGAHSVLEYRYLHAVEKPHGLPAALRQARVEPGGRKRYLDNLYKEFSLCVELDGRQAHPDERRWQDLQRINTITELGLTTLRYCWTDIDRHSCYVAGQVATVLRRLGWQGTPQSCGVVCQVGRQETP